jgi:hypothetical protein
VCAKGLFVPGYSVHRSRPFRRKWSHGSQSTCRNHDWRHPFRPLPQPSRVDQFCFFMFSVSRTPRPNANVHSRTAPTTIAGNAPKSKSRVFRSLLWGRSRLDPTQSQQTVSRAFAVLLGIALLGSLPCILKDSSPKGFAPNNGAAGAIRVSVRKQTLTLIAPFDCLGEFWRPCGGLSTYQSVNCGLSKRHRAQPSRSTHVATSNPNPTFRKLTKSSGKYQPASRSTNPNRRTEARTRSAGCKKSSQSRPWGQDLTSACIN